MAPDPDTAAARPAWFVGASFGGGAHDRTDRFIREGVWEHGFQDRWIEEIKSIHVGDRIAIKSAYTRKYDLPIRWIAPREWGNRPKPALEHPR